MKTTKNLLFLGLFCLMATTAASAQSMGGGNHEIILSTGIATTNDISETLSDIFVPPLKQILVTAITGIEAKDIKVGESSFSPTFGLRFKNYNLLGKNLVLVADLYYQYGKTKYYQDSRKIASSTANYYTAGLGVDYLYINKSKFQLYSGLAAAGTLVTNTAKQTIGNNSTLSLGDNDSETRFNYQINLIGFRYGKPKGLGVNAELGFGYRGIGNIGVSYRF